MPCAQFQSFGMQTQLMASPRKEAWEHLGDWNGLEGLQQQEGEDGMPELLLRGEQPDCAEANPAPVDPSSSRSQLQSIPAQQVFQLTGHTCGLHSFVSSQCTSSRKGPAQLSGSGSIPKAALLTPVGVTPHYFTEDTTGELKTVLISFSWITEWAWHEEIPPFSIKKTGKQEPCSPSVGLANSLGTAAPSPSSTGSSSVLTPSICTSCSPEIPSSSDLELSPVRRNFTTLKAQKVIWILPGVFSSWELGLIQQPHPKGRESLAKISIFLVQQQTLAMPMVPPRPTLAGQVLLCDSSLVGRRMA
ncbi:hypothetical protein IHE44_0006268 [Lamprotornis superbus]|uniref:Uncharacterized protein n=1 Tax=Lamprotornis superbus TaxID=245042 RepID=A0A835U1Q1_9PASS|nr:hypothetical protein IHE44_0006268 [Lamprotornis superbus]